MKTLTIPAIAKYGYIIPTKKIADNYLTGAKITITVEPKQTKKKNKLDMALNPDNPIVFVGTMDEHIADLKKKMKK